MRERLASGRARSDMQLAGAEAFGDRLGSLLLHGLDNGDVDCLRRAKWALAGSAAAQHGISMTQACKAAHSVLRALADQRCEVCAGRGHIVRRDGVHSPCLACHANRYTETIPHQWGAEHRSVRVQALTAMARHARLVRAQMES